MGAHEGPSEKDRERWKEREKDGSRRRPLADQSEMSGRRLQREEISWRGVQECWAKSPERNGEDSDLFSDQEDMDIKEGSEKKKKKKSKKEKKAKKKKSKKSKKKKKR